MSFGEAIKSVFSKYATFSGRARRSEFWYFFLLNFIICFVLGFIPVLSWVSGLWSLAILIPFVAVTVRRFHDIGKTGWLTILWFICPPIGPVVAIVLTIKDGDPGANAYGDEPAAPAAPTE